MVIVCCYLPATGFTDGYSNLIPLGLIKKTLKGSNMNNTVSYAVEQ
jgi:hypothetical protein